MAAWRGVLSFGQWIRDRGKQGRDATFLGGWVGFSLLYFSFFSGLRVLGLRRIFLIAGVLQV